MITATGLNPGNYDQSARLGENSSAGPETRTDEQALVKTIQSAATAVESARRNALERQPSAAGHAVFERSARSASWLSKVGRKIGELVAGQVQPGGNSKIVSDKRDLIRLEIAKVGSEIFSPPPSGSSSFFSPDAHSFVYHAQDAGGSTLTLRYEIHPSGIIKTAPGPDGRLAYEQLGLDELKRLATAADTYARRVLAELYG
ncbi:MAG: hypothetical protein EOT04_03085 [Candidatus Chaera renei]|uniref:Uncharacterized protein n=1 Tax=Candidatus Chaera renei TaxID=2506947 RepID=A0A4Q0AG82_9BACT|nr:MAG: hypothetical protein EOT04_03085 [Candidatus Chaera renei]